MRLFYLKSDIKLSNSSYPYVIVLNKETISLPILK